MSQQPTRQGLLIASISTVILSTTGVIIYYINTVYGTSPLVCAFWRNVFLVLLLGLILELFYPFLIELDRKDFGYLMRYGFLLSIFNVSWQTSVQINGAGVATVLVCLSSIFTVVLASIFLNEKMSNGKLTAAVIACFGTLLITDSINLSSWLGNLAGTFCGVFSGLCYSLYCLMGKNAASRNLNGWTVMLYSFLFSAGFILLYLLTGKIFFPGSETFHIFSMGSRVDGWAFIFLLAAGPTLLGFGLVQLSFRYLEVSMTNLILTVEPIFTMILAYILLGERLTALEVTGSSLIITAVFVVCWKEVQNSAQYESVLDSGWIKEEIEPIKPSDF